MMQVMLIAIVVMISCNNAMENQTANQSQELSTGRASIGDKSPYLDGPVDQQFNLEEFIKSDRVTRFAPDTV